MEVRKSITQEELKQFTIGQEERTVLVPLSEQQLTEAREGFIQSASDVADLEEELRSIVKDYRQQIKDKKAQMKLKLTEVKVKAVEETIPCFLIDDQDTGLMLYYTESGKLVYTRPLRPDERQGKLFELKAHTGTDGANEE